MQGVEKCVHHGVEVSVISEVKGLHRQHCLCHQNCKHFKPNTPENCEIAQANYELCVKHNLTTPVYECAKYEKEHLNTEYNLPIEYKNHRFNVKVELNWKVKRTPNGRRFHRITVNDTGPRNYHQVNEEVMTSTLENSILMMIFDVKRWVDEQDESFLSQEQQILMKLNFK